MTTEELSIYLRRIEVDEEKLSSLSKIEQLRILQKQHCEHIPFENTQVLYSTEKIPVQVDLKNIFEKLVLSKHGGYCFEQNTLLFAVLQSLGFKAEIKPARVLVNSVKPKEYPGLTHIVLFVRDPENDSETWFVDGGFGSYNPIDPLLFVEETKATSAGIDYYFKKVPTYSLASNEPKNVWVLYTFVNDAVFYLMEFEEGAVFNKSDIILSNYYVCSHPNSFFPRALYISGFYKHDKNTRVSFWNLNRTERNIQSGTKVSVVLKTAEELDQTLTNLDIVLTAEQLSSVFAKAEAGLATR